MTNKAEKLRAQYNKDKAEYKAAGENLRLHPSKAAEEMYENTKKAYHESGELLGKLTGKKSRK